MSYWMGVEGMLERGMGVTKARERTQSAWPSRVRDLENCRRRDQDGRMTGSSGTRTLIAPPAVELE